MARVKLRIIQLIDWCDDAYFGHRWHGICEWLDRSPWWGEPE